MNNTFEAISSADLVTATGGLATDTVSHHNPNIQNSHALPPQPIPNLPNVVPGQPSIGPRTLPHRYVIAR